MSARGQACRRRLTAGRATRRTAGPAEEPLDQIFNVFTLRDGRIVRIVDYGGRREARAAAGVDENADWH